VASAGQTIQMAKVADQIAKATDFGEQKRW
jgi:hypothetical protein